MNDHPCPECGLTGAHLVSCQTNMRHAVVFNAMARVFGAHQVFVPLGARFEAATEALRDLNDLNDAIAEGGPGVLTMDEATGRMLSHWRNTTMEAEDPRP